MLNRKRYTIADLFWMFVRHWQWFVLSVIICLSLAFLYTWYVTPVYEITGKLMIKSPDGYRGNRWKHRITMIQNLGTVSNTLGIENEVERIWSSMVMRDVVMQLKLYTDYKEEERWKDRILYADQPVSVDLDPVHLDSLDKVAVDEFCTISLKMWKRADGSLIVKGTLLNEDEAVWTFGRHVKSLPASIPTPYGTLTFTKNPQGKPMTEGKYYQAMIYPPIYKALSTLGSLSVKQASSDYSTFRSVVRYYYRLSSIVDLSIRDQNAHRGMDIIRQIEMSYNRQATADKNEIALRSEEFIIDRLNRLSKELGAMDANIVSIKQQGGLTSLSDAAQSVSGSDRFSSKLSDAETQVMIIDELSTLVDAPSRRYDIIPTSLGLDDKTTVGLIDRYNMLVQDRNRLLRSASEDAVQVKQLTATIDEMHSAVVDALQHARQSAAISQEGIASQYNTYTGQVSNVPLAERALMEEARDQQIKTKLYKLLLKRREETQIAQSSVAIQGKLIDEPHFEGRVRPNLLLSYGIALAVGIGIPYMLLILMGFLNYKLEGHEELAEMTDIPVIADVPSVGDGEKGKANIAVQEGMNRPIDEVFRLMRTNLTFMLRGDRHTILFTSTTSGEGKTFNAANLAVSYALLGKKVVLCGLDIRKPALGALFGLHDHKKGISVLLPMTEVTAADVMEQIQPSDVNRHLDLLLAGPVPPNSTELLARDSLRQIIGILKESYDYVILDTAPIGLVTDTYQVVSLADVTVYVCRVGYTPKYAIGQLNGLIDEKKLPNPCIILNGC